MKFFPNSQKLNCISISHPVLNDKSGIIVISIFCNICQRNIFIFKIFRVNPNINSFCVNNFPKSLINLILSFLFLQIGKQCSGIYPAHFCLLGKISVPLRSVQSRRPPDVLHPNPLELRISRGAKLTLYHKITFSSLNLPHKDTLLPQVFFSETLFVHYASFLFL